MSEYKINRPCVKWGCPRDAVDRGYCKEDAPPLFFHSRRAERLPKDWAQRRAYVLKRDNFICYYCGGSGADGVDHVKAGDDHSFDNLKAIHHNTPPFCHRSKTAKDAQKEKDNLKKKFAEEKRKRRFG